MFNDFILQKINNMCRLYNFCTAVCVGLCFDGNCYLFIKMDSNKNGFLDKYDVQVFGKIFVISHKNGCQDW